MSKQKSSGMKIQWGRLLKKLSPYTIQKGFRYLKHYGPREFWIRLHERFEPEEVPYDPWYEAYIPDETALEKQRKHPFAYAPKISVVVPAYRTPSVFLKQMLESVLAQTYANWELCIANGSPEDKEMCQILDGYQTQDPRIRWQPLKANLGIAENTNAAFEMAQGDYIGLMDHDDLLAPNALFEVVQALNTDPRPEVVYTDEDKVTMDLKEHFQPHLKPDFNLDLLRSNNYICHFFTVSRAIMEKVGGFRREYDGAQDYDFIFRCVEAAGCVAHVPEILYHWRTHKASTADNPASKMYAFDAGKRAIEAHLERTGTPGVVSHTKDLGFYRVKYPVQGSPLVSVIIPNKDEKDTLQACIRSIRENTSYKHYEILIVENNSTTDEIFEYYKQLSKEPDVRILRWNGVFNYSAINDFGAKNARGDYFLFLNNDITVITPDWMEEMLGVCQRREVGAVGVKLLYPDNTIQHAGCVVGMGGIAGHMFVDMPAERTGYLHKASLLQDMSAVTAACMMVKKSEFDSVKGFDETFQVAFNDIDLCMKFRASGKKIVFTPYAELYHYESKSRGLEDTPEKQFRFDKEVKRFQEKWAQQLEMGDPYYSPNLSVTEGDCSLRED